jgi:hypothetical protein
MIEFITIPLEQLCGKHVLDAVDVVADQIKSYGDQFMDANAIRFRLDGVIYTAVENPDDGYCSSMDRLFVTLDCKMKNVFPPIEVLVMKKDNTRFETNNTLEFIDITTCKVVLEIGTDNTDDYYPRFVASFNPENMVSNEAPKTKAG